MKTIILTAAAACPVLLCTGAAGAAAAVTIWGALHLFTTRTAKGRAALFAIGRTLVKLENLFTNL